MLTWIHSFFSLLFPRYCVVCHHSLSHSEECLCTVCNMGMPRTNFHLQKDNPAEKLFWAQMPIERATCFFHYHKGNDFCRIVQEMKYKGRKHIGEAMGR